MGREVLQRSIKVTPLCPKTQGKATWRGLPRPAWTGVGRFQSSMLKCGLAPISICGCGAFDQIAARAIVECPLHHALIEYLDLLKVIDDETRCSVYNFISNTEEDLP